MGMWRSGVSFGLVFMFMIVYMFSFTMAAYTVVIVTPVDLQGWTPYTRSDATVSITDDFPRNGSGSLMFTSNTITPGQDKADFNKIWGVVPGRRLGSLVALSFDAYRAGASNTLPHFSPVYRILFYHDPGTPLDTTDDTTGYLIWEAVYNGYSVYPEDVWVSHNILNDFFWMYVIDGPGGRGVVQNYHSTINDWIWGSPQGIPGDPVAPDLDENTLIVGISVGIGSGWGNDFIGAVDNVRIGFSGNDDVIYNFEPYDTPVVIPSPSHTPTPTPCFSSISGVIFEDANYNGQRESGELGIGGISVYLDGAIRSRTVSRNEWGSYTFVGMPPGDYVVYIDVPPNMHVTTVYPIAVSVPKTRCYQAIQKNIGLVDHASITPTPVLTLTPSPTPSATPAGETQNIRSVFFPLLLAR